MNSRSKGYRKGYRAELQVAEYLRATGHYAMHSRGSHGVFDVIGVSMTGVRMIQVKDDKDGISRAEYNKIVADAIEYLPRNGTAEIWEKAPRRGYAITQITIGQPKSPADDPEVREEHDFLHISDIRSRVALHKTRINAGKAS